MNDIQQTMMQFNCGQCQTSMIAPQPILRVFNAVDCSSIVSIHNKKHRCPSCGTTYICVFHPQGLDPEGKLMFVWAPVVTKESAIVKANNQEDINKAVEQSKIKLV
jgi:predicted RNA-binding Zn-ribbon protein involved in translation (DUF1610 family)